MVLIAGLGNPGDKYKNTRHNVGFMVIDKMIKELTSQTNINKSSFNADVVKSLNKLLVKPKTFMNNSGQSIVSIQDYYKINLDEIIVIHDDLDLPFGTVKFKIGGGHGGHNGLRSIDSHISKEYVRIRVGIGKPSVKSDVANYVLSDFSKEELKQLEDIIEHIIKVIPHILNNPIDDIKSKFTLK